MKHILFYFILLKYKYHINNDLKILHGARFKSQPLQQKKKTKWINYKKKTKGNIYLVDRKTTKTTNLYFKIESAF